MDTTTTTPTTTRSEPVTGEYSLPPTQDITPRGDSSQKPQNVNMTTLVVDSVRDLEKGIGTVRLLERIDIHNTWVQMFILLLIIEQLGILIALGVLIAR